MFDFVINEKFFDHWIEIRIVLLIYNYQIFLYIEMNITIMFTKTYLVKLNLGEVVLHFISETCVSYRISKLLLVFWYTTYCSCIKFLYNY